MNRKDLATYLNDHLAGSEGALELLEHVRHVYAGTTEAGLAVEFLVEIGADRKELEALMAGLQVTTSGPRKAAAWLAEKLTELKLRVDDIQGGPLRLLEIFDALSVGIEGKRLLWLGLKATSERVPELRGPDYETLIQRAEDQRERLESFRVRAAIAALTR